MFEALRNLSESILGKTITDILSFSVHCLMFFWVIQIIYRIIRDVKAGRKNGFNLGTQIGKNFTIEECQFIANDCQTRAFIRQQIRAYQDYETRSYIVDYNEIYEKIMTGIRDVPSFEAYQAPRRRAAFMAKIAAHRAEQIVVAKALEAGTVIELTPYSNIEYCIASDK